jgi:hypothetical protein
MEAGLEGSSWQIYSGFLAFRSLSLGWQGWQVKAGGKGHSGGGGSTRFLSELLSVPEARLLSMYINLDYSEKPSVWRERVEGGRRGGPGGMRGRQAWGGRAA